MTDANTTLDAVPNYGTGSDAAIPEVVVAAVLQQDTLKQLRGADAAALEEWRQQTIRYLSAARPSLGVLFAEQTEGASYDRVVHCLKVVQISYERHLRRKAL